MARDHDGPLTLGGKEHENLESYISGFLAAIRTYRRLTEDKPLRVEVADGGRIPLAQRILLR